MTVQLERVRAIKNKSIKRIDLLTYAVTSSTDKEVKYMVYKTKDIGWTCTCKDFMFRSDPTNNEYQCKHIIRVKNLITSSARKQFVKTLRELTRIPQID